MRTFNRWRQVRLGAAMAVVALGVVACDIDWAPGVVIPPPQPPPTPSVTTSSVTFASVGNARLLVYGDPYWFLIDGTTKRVTQLPTRESYGALSPNGSAIAYMRVVSYNPMRYGAFVSRRDGTHPIRVSGFSRATESALSWSPDGAWLYFTDGLNGSVRRVRRSGGLSEVVRAFPRSTPGCPWVGSNQSLSISASGEFAFACEGAIYVASAQGTRLALRSPTPDAQQFGSPVWSPDETRLAFVVTDSVSSIRIVDAATGSTIASLPVQEALKETGGAPGLCWHGDQNAFAYLTGTAVFAVGASGGGQTGIVSRPLRHLTCSG